MRLRKFSFVQIQKPVNRFKLKLLLYLFLLILGAYLQSGCFSLPRVETVIHEGQQGSVFLKEFHKESFRADHPANFEAQLVRKILVGIQVHERKTFVESTLTGSSNATPIFTFSEVKFLTPHLVAAFEQATPEEAIHFEVNGDVSGKRFDTEGFMYVTDNNLTLSLTKYGLTPQRGGTLSQPTVSFNRPKRWSVTFTPISAVLNAEADNQVIGDENVSQPLHISLLALNKQPLSLPEDTVNSNRTPSQASEEVSPHISTPSKTERTSEELKKEIHQLRKSMKEQEDRLKKLEGQMDQ